MVMFGPYCFNPKEKGPSIHWLGESVDFKHSVDSKELSVVIHTDKHNYITSIIVTMRVLTTTCCFLQIDKGAFKQVL